MLPKAKYMKLSPAAKAKLKRRLGMGPGATQRRIKGHGDYAMFTPGDVGKGKSPFSRRTSNYMNSAGGSLGELIGSKFGMGKIGRSIGGGAHAIFKKITGYGDYKVASNSLITGNEPPMFAKNGRGTVIAHREFLGDVLSTTAFNVTSFPINAGLPVTFPWANAIANQFEQYCIRGMVFQYRTTSATSLTSGTSTAMGSILMATAYDSVQPNFTTESQMLNHEYSTSCVPSRDCIHPIECARGETPVSCLYTRSGAVPTGADKRLYDLGNFQIATIGMQHAGDVIGQLWCTYSIELLKPQIGVSGASAYVDHYHLDATASGTVPNMWGTTVPTVEVGSNAGTSLSRSGSQSINFPSSSLSLIYLIQYSLAGTQVAIAAATGFNSFGGTAAAYNLFQGDTVSFQTPTVGDAVSVYWYECAVSVPASPTASSVVFSGFTTPGTVTSGDLFITALPTALVTARVSSRRVPADIKEAARAARKESKEEQKTSLSVGSHEDSETDEEEEYAAFAAFKKAMAIRRAVAEPSVPPPTAPDTVAHATVKVPSKK